MERLITNQLEYNTNFNASSRIFTTNANSQPKPIIIEKIGFFNSDNEEKTNLSLSSLELAVQLAKRDLNDEINVQNNENNINPKMRKKNVKFISTNHRLKNSFPKTKQNFLENSLLTNNNTNALNVNKLPARSFSPPTKDVSNSKMLTNGRQLFENSSTNKKPRFSRYSSDILKMSSDIVTCMTALHEKIMHLSKSKTITYLEDKDIQRISSRIIDRNSRILRLLFSLSTDWQNVGIRVDKEEIAKSTPILNQLNQCFRNVLLILCLLLQQLTDWQQVGHSYIGDSNVNLIEHSTNLASIVRELFGICVACENIANHEKLFEFISVLSKLSFEKLVQPSNKIEDSKKSINREMENRIFREKDTDIIKTRTRFHDQTNHKHNKMFDTDFINERNDKGNIFSTHRNNNDDEGEDDIAGEDNFHQKPDFSKRQVSFLSRKQPKKNFMINNKMVHGRKHIMAKLKNNYKKYPNTTNAPLSIHQPNLHKKQISNNINKIKRSNYFNKINNNNTALHDEENNRNLINQKEWLQTEQSLAANFWHQSRENSGLRDEGLDSVKRVKIERLANHNQAYQQIDDITNSMLNDTLYEIASERQKLEADNRIKMEAHNFALHQDVDIMARRLREIELEKLEIRKRWRTIEYENEFDSGINIDEKTQKPIIFTNHLTKVYPKEVQPIINPKLKTAILTDGVIENILHQKKEYKRFIHKSNYGTEDEIETLYFNPESLLDKISDDILVSCLEEIGSEIESLNDNFVGNIYQSEIELCQ